MTAILFPVPKPARRSKRGIACAVCGAFDCHRPHAGIPCPCPRCSRQRERRAEKVAAFFARGRRGPLPAGERRPRRRRRRWRLPPGYRSVHRRAWTRQQACLVRELNPRSACEGIMHAHHAGRRYAAKIKASDQTCIPLCAYHHGCWHAASGPFRDLGRGGRKEWAIDAVVRTQAFYAAEHPDRVAAIEAALAVAA